MTIPSPFCLLRALWGRRVYLSPAAWRRSLRGNRLALATIGGHVLQDVEVHVGCTVIVSRCLDCGEQKISWHHGAPSPPGEELTGACYCHAEAPA